MSGKVLVRRPGSREFVELDATAGIPDGSTIDTKRGVVELISASGTARFRDGIFRINRRGALTDLTLTEALAPCKRSGARASAKKPKSRKLWGQGCGKFRTVGSVQRGDGPGHAVARPGQLLRDADPGHPRVGLGP